MAKKQKDMTPAQSHEVMQELLELQKEEADLKRKMDKAAEHHKNAKANHDAKSDEIMALLEALKKTEAKKTKKADPVPVSEPVST